MGGRQDKRKEPGKEPSKGREAQEHHRPGDPAHSQPGRSSREQAQKQGQGQGQGREETSRRREDDLLREEDLHDETL